jgi:hypothetical protein
MECRMTDVLFLAASIVFFLIAGLYVYGCEELKGGRNDA